MIKVVVDTNVLISALLKPDSLPEFILDLPANKYLIGLKFSLRSRRPLRSASKSTAEPQRPQRKDEFIKTKGKRIAFK
jgi:predicted nucleic acid-binding protein